MSNSIIPAQEVERLKGQRSDLKHFKSKEVTLTVQVKLEESEKKLIKAYCALKDVRLSDLVSKFLITQATQANEAMKEEQRIVEMKTQKNRLDLVDQLDKINNEKHL